MGEVWRATDTKLNRDLALKILPEAFANDADRMAQFEREAQVLAALNHPNIAAIHGVEYRTLVMELVEGPTLAERIAAGPIPLADAEPIIDQMIDALEYAHEKGIIHRDLKPAEREGDPRRPGEASGHRLGEGVGERKRRRQSCLFAHPHHARDGDRRDHGNRRLYGSRTGSRAERRQADRWNKWISGLETDP